ncbi:hypothetical protein GCM10027040_25100 [Halomonas shantousis]
MTTPPPSPPDLMEDIFRSGAELTDLQRYWLARSVFEHCQEGILITNVDKVIIDINPAFTGITGYCREEVLGKKPYILSSGKHGSQFYQHMFADIAETGYWTGNIKNRHKQGRKYVSQTSITAVHDAHGTLTHYIAIFRDVTQSRLTQARLERLAIYDPLTRLFNREHFGNALDNLLEGLKYTESGLALLFLDLDDFKPINDSFGHAAGDELLIEISRRLRRLMRHTDMIARFGGDEFMVALPGMAHPDMAGLVADKVLRETVRPFTLSNGQGVRVSASIGIAFTASHKNTAESLIDTADSAMYEAKQAGKNRIVTARATPVQHRDDVFTRIRHAFDNGELELFYQPIISLADLTTVGFEALARWRHPQRGVLGPQHFIDMVTGSSLSLPFGCWLIHEAGRVVKQLQDQGTTATVSINLTQEQIEAGGFLQTLAETRDKLGLVTPFLTIEILESSHFHDVELVSSQLQEAHQLGAMVALDDFGAGISSVTYVTALPIDTLKIDRSMIKRIADRNDQRELVRGVTLMAQATHRQVLAEGVESEAQFQLIREIGCDLAQGYYLGYPMPEHELYERYLTPLTCPTYPLRRREASL